MEEGDTLQLTAVALDRSGNELPDVQIVWHVIALDTTQVGFALDSLTGLISAASAGGPWNVQAQAEGLRTNPPIKVTVTPAPDSVGGEEPTRVTTAADGDVSPPLVAVVYDLTTQPGNTLPLGGKTVVFRLVDPLPGSPEAATVALGAAGDTVGTDPFTVERRSSSAGQVAVTARRVSGVQPDSIIVEAVGLTARRDTVPGSPVRFIVLFAQN